MSDKDLVLTVVKGDLHIGKVGKSKDMYERIKPWTGEYINALKRELKESKSNESKLEQELFELGVANRVSEQGKERLRIRVKELEDMITNNEAVIQARKNERITDEINTELRQKVHELEKRVIELEEEVESCNEEIDELGKATVSDGVLEIQGNEIEDLNRKNKDMVELIEEADYLLGCADFSYLTTENRYCHWLERKSEVRHEGEKDE